MTDEIKIWAIDSSSPTDKGIEMVSANRTETEKWLEDALVANPEILMPGLTLVGRQTPVAGGYLDLLGVDGDGRLVVFELKRNAPSRDAVAQVIDYCSYLDDLTYSQLGELIRENSGSRDIILIEDFEEWYSENTNGKELTDLKPTRMVLVGVGADDSANRMVRFLAERDIDIRLLTFNVYHHGEKTLLARQVQLVESGTDSPSSKYVDRAKRRINLDERAQNMGISDFWHRVISDLTRWHWRDPSPRVKGYTFYQKALKLPGLAGGHRAGASHVVQLDENKKIRFTFFPVAVHLCKPQFDSVGLFETEDPSRFQATDRVDKQYYCVLDEAGWEEHKDTLLSLVDCINKAWDRALEDNAEPTPPARLDA